MVGAVSDVTRWPGAGRDRSMAPARPARRWTSAEGEPRRLRGGEPVRPLQNVWL